MKTSLSVAQQEDPFPLDATSLSTNDTAHSITPCQSPVIAGRNDEPGRSFAVLGSEVHRQAGCTRGASAMVPV